MQTLVRDVMTADPKCVASDASMREIAVIMRDHDIGDVIVADDGQITGIITDRDLVTRGMASNGTPTAAEIATGDVTVIQEESPTTDAVYLMREQAIRRLPVADIAGRPVGIISIGDLAQSQDEHSALADISAADPNN